ncbi:MULTISPECIES: PPK2 family polyphosphate kinase [Myroides]|uniref:Phosphate--nucleotide phosphotransferase n=3 Tax=Myroides odoratimimus TaxID=76832 RepID=A0AAI8C5Q6_9FLAO|nr:MULTISPECIES: PPK2 family polyphosphate kinase [Myroides]ALU26482.1 phosphate--nucleotide phosphotransferase [Myroides odoratimimus]APA92538.1 phosphate--nucleotide phosphotransferase [Myroides sp. ZB35]EHO12029.1 PPK2 family polyphosphate:nucleotide phosphotransferase [Myroides odoratimimus CCUG 10230]EHO13195.1 PPK2 family polyphosphate:nucleotide phosphotransferase [Myroides odoratimimus CCUG 12901]EHO13991.1 PPK2 family polyphosphate:nucleotide phosphotransferase [Myroides odoratimimus 
MNIEEKYRIDNKVELEKLSTVPDLNLSMTKAFRKVEKLSRNLGKFQDVMYAHNRYSVLICIQGMDTAGKDSLIREVFKAFNARGVVVQSFKKPTSYELEHDYIWRHYVTLPERGKFTVFNRSHYENVLISRVHPQVVLNERIPGINKAEDITDEFWDKRYEEINNFEKHISNNGVIVLKFFLHLSKKEQKKRILRRLEKEKHNWKFEPSDIKEREYWDDYQKYYEEAINRTSTAECPWYVLPADDKAYCRYVFAKILEEVFSKYDDIKLPKLDPEIQKDLDMYIEKLKNEE